MPNIIIETSRPDLITKPESLLSRINSSLWSTGQFGKPEDIKARIFHPQHSLVGLSSENTMEKSHEFVYVHFYLMPGRSDAIKKTLVDAIATAIASHISEHENLYQAGNMQGKLQICVNPIELSENYKKMVI